MLIDKNGVKKHNIIGLALVDRDIILLSGQHFEQSVSGKRINLLETDGYFVRKIDGWNSSSVAAYIVENRK